VQFAEQLTDPPDTVVAPGIRVGDLTLDAGEHLVAAPVVAVADLPWRADEADGPQMPQQGVDGGGP
jgi:hypothetical protein